MSIIELNEKIEMALLSDRALEQKVFVELTKMISSAYQHAMQQTELNYCFKFNLPYVGVGKRLYKLIGITTDEAFDAYKKDWGSAAMTNHMHKDSYYHILLSLIYYGLKHKKPQITENSFFILLMKIWNGRREKYMPFCDPKIMSYIISKMNKKYIVGNHDSPLFMIKDYFIPTLLKKYSSNVLRNPGSTSGLKRLFEQSWGRIVQLWVQSKQVNLKTGKTENSGGLLPLYMKAKQDGSALKTTVGNVEDETSYMSINEREIISQDVADFIINSNTTRSSTFKKSLYRITNVNKTTIPIILDGIRDHSLFNDFNDLVLLLLSRLEVNSKEELCKFDLFTKLKKKVISSKNNDEVFKIRKICNIILNTIFKKKQMDIKVEKMALPTQGKIRNLILILTLTDIKTSICHERIDSSKFKFIPI